MKNSLRDYPLYFVMVKKLYTHVFRSDRTLHISLYSWLREGEKLSGEGNAGEVKNNNKANCDRFIHAHNRRFVLLH